MLYPTEETVFVDLRSVVEIHEWATKRSGVVFRCEITSGAPSTATYLALLTELGVFKNRFEKSALENQYISGLAAEAKELRVKVANHRIVVAATKNVSARSRRKKLFISVHKRITSLEARLMKANKLHWRAVVSRLSLIQD